MSVYIWLSLITAVAALVSAITALYLGHKERRLIRRLFTETGHEQFGEVLLNHQRQLRRGQEDLSRQQKKHCKARQRISRWKCQARLPSKGQGLQLILKHGQPFAQAFCQPKH